MATKNKIIVVDKARCPSCGRYIAYTKDNFYASFSPLHQGAQNESGVTLVPYCKQCVLKDMDINNMLVVKNALLMCDFEKKEWRIPARRMKMNTIHIVPLSDQAISILKEVQMLTGSSKYVFHSIRSRSREMSDNTINAALRRMGYTKEEMTCHGFRSMASTLLNEHGWNRDAIERQLAHAERNGVRAAYNYAEYLPERKKMMQWYADYLDSLREGAKIIPFHRAS